MKEVYLLLGSNVGNRCASLADAETLIGERCGHVESRSALYETEAWGMKEQEPFINVAVKISTELTPVKLLAAIKRIEEEIGRRKRVKWGPREIDIDIIFYGTEVIALPELKIPHPFLHQRRFTLKPLNEIAAEMLHPVLGKTVSQLLADCPDNSAVRKMDRST